MSINKNGVLNTNTINESLGMNILNNAYKYTRTNPYVVSGTNSDIIATTDMFARVSSGETYYLSCKVSPGWSPSHGYSDASKGKATIWLYLSKTYNESNYGYDSPILFTSTSAVTEGVWKYTIPAGYNMARIRLNTYSNGTNSVTCKFWDISLIPEKYYVGNGVGSKIGNDYVSFNQFYEI